MKDNPKTAVQAPWIPPLTQGWRVLLAVVAAAFAAELWVIGYRVGAGWGALTLLISGLILYNRPRPRWTRETVVLCLCIALTALQSARFSGFFNCILLLALPIVLSAESAAASQPEYKALRKRSGARWFEAALALLRPLGSLIAYKTFLECRHPGSRFGLSFLRGLMLIGPLLLILPLFLWLISLGNAVIRHWLKELLSAINRWLLSWQAPEFWVVVSMLLVACLVFTLVVPARPSPFLRRLSRDWNVWSETAWERQRLRWIIGLVLLNALFALSNGIDIVVFLTNAGLPEGVTYTRYVHEAVYGLIATTLMSACLIALLSQMVDRVRKDRGVLRLAYLWILQNGLLLFGVAYRLYLYVDAYGYTPRRIGVALFLLLVITGFLILVFALHRGRRLQWVLRCNVLALLVFFLIVQLLDVRGFCAARNLSRYERGTLELPSWLHLSHLDSAAFTYLIGIYNNPQTPEDREQVITWLKRPYAEPSLSYFQPIGEAHQSWPSFQLRAARNWAKIEAFAKAEDLWLEAFEAAERLIPKKMPQTTVEPAEPALDPIKTPEEQGAAPSQAM